MIPASNPNSPPAWPRLPSPQAEVIAYLAARSLPCPRCGYDLHALTTATCPECAEPLELRLSSAKVNFGWLIVAMAPGCFSGVAALFVSIPIVVSIWHGFAPGSSGVPWPIIAADIFGYSSAASLVLIYRRRAEILSRPRRQQAAFAGIIWAIHIAAFFLVLVGLWLST